MQEMKSIVHNRILVYCCWFSVFHELPLEPKVFEKNRWRNAWAG